MKCVFNKYRSHGVPVLKLFTHIKLEVFKSKVKVELKTGKHVYIVFCKGHLTNYWFRPIPKM